MNGSEIPDYLDKSVEIIAHRWPELLEWMEMGEPLHSLQWCADLPQPTLLINGIHLTSGYDQAREAWLQVQMIPETSEVAWVYGVGSGALPRALLGRKSLRQVNVVLFNPAVFAATLQYFDCADWLTDERIRFHMAQNMEELQAPYCASPGCLKLTDAASVRLRDMMELELETPYVNARFRNNTAHVTQIMNNEKHVASDHDVAELFGGYSGQRVIVAGAGPTLTDQVDWMKGAIARGARLISVDASLKVLAENGIDPDQVVSTDGMRDTIYTFFDFDLSGFHETPLVYFPVVHPDVIERWPGPRYAAYAASPVYSELAEVYPRGELFSAGSVLHAAVDLAVKSGAADIVLVGADFGFPGGMSHAKGSPFSQAVPDTLIQDWLPDGKGGKIGTIKNLRGYLRDLERYILAHSQIQFFNASRRGAVIKGCLYLDEGDG